MKSPRQRAHLIDAAEPLTEGQTYMAICGVDVPNARWVLGGDAEHITNIREVVSRLNGLCSHCKDVSLEGRYVYAIRTGQEEKLLEEAI